MFIDFMNLQESKKDKKLTGEPQSLIKRDVTGRWLLGRPSRQIKVKIDVPYEPQEMLKGMEEFFNKAAPMKFGEKPKPWFVLYQSLIEGESQYHKVFTRNLNKMTSDYLKETGIDTKKFERPPDPITIRKKEIEA